MPEYATLIGAYVAAVSLLAAGMVMFDKHAAQKGKRRIKESKLLLVCAIGGSVAMYTAMRLIRHKTKHLKFMLGIPLIFVVQVATMYIIWRLVI